MDSPPIQNRRDYREATTRLLGLLEIDPAPGSRGEAELEALASAVQRYETRHFPIEPPTPAEAVQFRLDQLGIEVKGES